MDFSVAVEAVLPRPVNKCIELFDMCNYFMQLIAIYSNAAKTLCKAVCATFGLPYTLVLL